MIKPLKITSLAVGTLGIGAGGFYGMTNLFSLVKGHIEGSNLFWEGLWILKNGNTICEFPEPEENPKNAVDGAKQEKVSSAPKKAKPKQPSNICYSVWSKDIISRHKGKKPEVEGWWIRGKDEQSVKNMLQYQALQGEDLPKKFSSVSSPITFEELQRVCEVDKKSKRWIEIKCLGDSSQQEIRK